MTFVNCKSNMLIQKLDFMPGYLYSDQTLEGTFLSADHFQQSK